MNEFNSLLTSGLLLPDKSSGLSEVGSVRPSIGDEDLGYFAFEPRSKGESSSIDLFLSTKLWPFLSPSVVVCCLESSSCAACS